MGRAGRRLSVWQEKRLKPSPDRTGDGLAGKGFEVAAGIRAVKVTGAVEKPPAGFDDMDG
jgi:hypothetical protein